MSEYRDELERMKAAIEKEKLRKLALLKEATESFREMARTAEAWLAHARTCRVARSRIVAFFVECHDCKRLGFEHLAARRDTMVYDSCFRDLQLEIAMEDPEARVPDEWLEKLYELDDPRNGRGIK